MRAQRASTREDTRHGLQADTEGERTGGCGQRVRDVVATHDLQLDGGLPFWGHQSEGCAVGAVKAHVARDDIGTLVARGREADHGSGCQRSHGLDVRVIRVEDDRTARAGSLDELGLRSRNAFETTEATHVGMAHAQLNGHVGRDDIRQVGDVAGARSAHLENEVTRRFICQENGQRQTDLVVKGKLGGHRRPILTHDLEQQVLRRRLAHRTRHGDDVKASPAAQLVDVCPRQGSQRFGRIMHDNLSDGLVDFMLNDDSNGTALDGARHERVSVGGLAATRDVERSLGRLTRVGNHRACHEYIGTDQATRHCLSNPLR